MLEWVETLLGTWVFLYIRDPNIALIANWEDSAKTPSQVSSCQTDRHPCEDSEQNPWPSLILRHRITMVNLTAKRCASH